MTPLFDFLTRRANLLLLSAGLTLSTTSLYAGSILVNWDFEGSTYLGPNNDIVPTGWTVGPPGQISQSDLHIDTAVNPPTFLGPESGAHYVRFQSPAIDGTRDCLFQNLVTIPGQTYIVSFWVAITSTSEGNNLGLNPV